ncbi:MAG: hypothetical protein PHU56_02580 [Candidatus Pacebacteria bacterium]|nr:hypothetical protein [Candidatus Paceibacterota bacterium]
MIEVCPRRNILIAFIDWHFHGAPKGIIRAWRAFLFFNLRYFSVGELLKTLFSPWHKMTDSYGRGFDPQRFVTVFLGNMISRVMGALVRVVFIVIGLVFEFFILIIGLAVLLFWILLPVWLVLGLFAGAGLLM